MCYTVIVEMKISVYWRQIISYTLLEEMEGNIIPVDYIESRKVVR